MGILGYPNMDDNNQDGAFGDYSDVYSNFSEEENSVSASGAEENYSTESYDNVNLAKEEQNAVPQEDQFSEQSGMKFERGDNGRLFIYLVVLGLLLISAVGMFFYKKHMSAQESSVVSEQAMGDYFYDKMTAASQEKAENQAPEQTTQSANADQSANMATVEVDLNAAVQTPDTQGQPNAALMAKNTKSEKEMSALEKAMVKKKADEEKEKKLGFGNNSVVIPVSSGGRLDPFVPFGNQISASSKPKFDIIAPPLEVPESDPMVDKIMDFKLSGILYDSTRPSAILNIDGSEQLVHKGDVVMGYHILNITRKTVIVKYGTNTYEVSAGQSLEPGVNINTNSSLSKQFGGAYLNNSKGTIQFNN